MARKKNPLDKLLSAATDALKDPLGTAGKAVEQAKETAAVGRMSVVKTASSGWRSRSRSGRNSSTT